MGVKRYKPEIVLLHTPSISDPAVILRTAGIPEPFNLYAFSVLPAEENDKLSTEARAQLVRVMENRYLSHLIIQDRLMDPMAGMAKLAIGCACWYSPTQEGFSFESFDEDKNVTEMPLERAKGMAQFVEIPDFNTVLDINHQT